jgi:hypothetical protein
VNSIAIKAERDDIPHLTLTGITQFRVNWAVNPQTGEYTASTRTPTGIPTDPPLAAKGVEQSKELSDYLCSLDPPIDRFYSSPFYRCLQTLKPTTQRLFAQGKGGGKIRIEHGVGWVPLSPLISPLFPLSWGMGFLFVNVR